MSERLQALRQMLAADPENQLARYGLAMELVNTGDPLGGAAEFEQLLERNPDYAAAYYHGGKALEKAGRIEEARELLERGLAVCQRIGDLKTANEIQGALDILGI